MQGWERRLDRLEQEAGQNYRVVVRQAEKLRNKANMCFRINRSPLLSRFLSGRWSALKDVTD